MHILMASILTIILGTQFVHADPGGRSSSLPKCIASFERLVNITSMSAEDQLMVLGPYRSTEIKLADGNNYSVAVDTQQKLRVVRRNTETGQLSTSLPIELDATTAKELSTRSITPISVADRFMLLAQGTNGQGSIIEILPQSKGLKRSQIQRVAKFNNRPDTENKTRGVWHTNGVSDLGNTTLNYFYETREKVFGATNGVQDMLIGKVLHLKNDRASNVSISTDKILFATSQNASGLHLLSPTEGTHHVAFAKPIQDVVINGETVRIGSVEVHELDVHTFNGASKLVNEIKIKTKASDGAVKSIYFVRSSRATHEQVYVVVIMEHAAYAGRLYSDVMMSRVDVNVQQYVQSFSKILSQENFDKNATTSAFNPDTVGISKYDKPGLSEDQIILGSGADARVTKLYDNFQNPKIEDLFQHSLFILNKKIDTSKLPEQKIKRSNFDLPVGDVHAGPSPFLAMAEAIAKRATKEELMGIRLAKSPETKMQLAKNLIIDRSQLTEFSKELEQVAAELIRQQDLIHFAKLLHFGYRR